MADLTLIHGGVGTVRAAALAGKLVVGIGMQLEQVANLSCLERPGFAIRVPNSKDPSREIQVAVAKLLHDESAKAKAAAFAKVIAKWDVTGEDFATSERQVVTEKPSSRATGRGENEKRG